ncbi:MAG: AEC family transporter [Pseudomonadota bacterium]
MLSVLIDPILPVFAILALGFALGRTGHVTVETARTLNGVTMSVIVPILLFGLLAEAPLGALAPLPTLLYAATQAVIFTLVFLALRPRLASGEAVVLAYAAIFANNVFFGLPIAEFLYVGVAGPEALLPLTAVVVLDSTLSLGGVMIALQALGTGQVSLLGIGRILIRTPALIAIFAGLGVASTGLNLPAPVTTFTAFNGAAAAPLALFALGVVLSGTAFEIDRAVAVTVAIKIAVFPMAIWAVLAAAAGGWDAMRPFAFAAAGPTGTMAFAVALLNGVPTARVAQVIVWSSLLSLLTLAALA